MNIARFIALPGLAVAIIGHLFLFAWFQELLRWHSIPQKSAWLYFRVSVVSAIALFSVVLVMWRGKPEEKVAAFVLALLPLFCLRLAFRGYLGGLQ